VKISHFEKRQKYKATFPISKPIFKLLYLI